MTGNNKALKGATLKQISELSPQRRKLLELMLKEKSGEASPPTLVKIQPEGDKTPFFCVHPASGEIQCYFDLTRYLGNEQPFYALQDPALFDITATRDTVEQTASIHLKEILKIQPKGHYLIGGHSAGGIVALEIAKRIVSQGKKVALLVIMDMYYRNINDGSDSQDVFFFDDIVNAILKNVHNKFDISGMSTEYLINLDFDDIIKLFPIPSDKSVQEIPMFRTIWHVFRHNVKASMKYRPVTYPGKITAFRALSRKTVTSTDETMGWGHIATDGVDVYPVTGHHLSMLEEPHVKTLAEKLSESIKKATN